MKKTETIFKEELGYAKAKKTLKIVKISLVLFLMSVINTYATTNTDRINSKSGSIIITGVITDSSGETLPGVAILEVGTSNGVVSDFDGNYEITVSDATSILSYSFMGMSTQEIKVGSKTVIDVIMQDDAAALDEVVVMGYTVQKKINVTGSVDVINSEALADRPVASVEQALQGAAPNLSISTGAGGGEPGAKMNWNIRGAGSITGDNSPLILVDGVEMDISSVSPESIESVTVLKDAAASAIYGARAPFGVVLITTKRGKKGSIQVSYNNNFGFASAINLPQYTNSMDVATAFNQAAANSRKSPYFNDDSLERIQDYMEGKTTSEYDYNSPYGDLFDGSRQGNANYNWVDKFFKKNSFRQTHNLSVSGGGEKTSYYLSGGMFTQDGLYNYGEDSFKRYNMMANVNSQVNDWFAVNFSTKFSKRSTDYPVSPRDGGREIIFGDLMRTLPTQPLNHEKGHNINPTAAFMEGAGRETNDINDLLMTIGATLEPIEGWVSTASFNYNHINNSYQKFIRDVLVETPTGDMQNLNAYGNRKIERELRTTDYSLFNVTTAYEKQLGNHYIKGMLGYEQELYQYVGLRGDKLTLFNPNVPAISAATGAYNVADEKGHSGTQGIFSRFNYNYKEKYLFEFNARYNGSSKFAKESRWGFFPSASFGYNISKEDFWEPIEPIANSMKIRVSYGSLGNQNVPNYLYLSTIPVNDQLRWIMGNTRPLYSGAPNLISPTLTWETITTANFGTDIAFLDNHLAVNFDYFIRETTDMFGPAQTVPAVLGTNPPKENNAEMITKGWETSIVWKDKIGADFSYNFRVIVGDNHTTITKYTSDNKFIYDWYEGKEVGEIWGFETKGFIQTQDQADDINDNDRQDEISGRRWNMGDIMYADLDGDGKITRGAGTIDDHGDYKVIGNTMPRFNYGLSFGASYKGFDFSMFWQGVGKRDLYIDAKGNSANHLFYGMVGSLSKSTMFEPHLDYWRPADETNSLGPNTDAYYPRPYATKEQMKNLVRQSKFLLDASYLRLKNVQLGYTFNQSLLERMRIQKLRVFVSAENVLTITKLTKLIDPETPQESTNKIIYPLSRVLSFGMNLTF